MENTYDKLSPWLREALHSLATRVPKICLRRIDQVYPSLNTSLPCETTVKQEHISDCDDAATTTEHPFLSVSSDLGAQDAPCGIEVKQEHISDFDVATTTEDNFFNMSNDMGAQDANQFFNLDPPDVKPEKVLPAVATDLSRGFPIISVSRPTCDETGAVLVAEQVHVMDNTIGEAAATVSIMKPFTIPKSLEGQWRISQDEEMEQVETKWVTENLCIQSSVGRESAEMNRCVKFEEENENLPDQDPDLSVLEIRMSINKSAIPSKSRSSIKQCASKKKTSNQQLANQSCGPARQSFPSTSNEDNLVLPTSGSQHRKSSSCSDESLTVPAKLPRLTADGDKDRRLRERNNEAVRKFRHIKKSREAHMKDIATKLEKENRSLRIKVNEMELLVKVVREALCEAVTKMECGLAKQQPHELQPTLFVI